MLSYFSIDGIYKLQYNIKYDENNITCMGFIEEGFCGSINMHVWRLWLRSFQKCCTSSLICFFFFFFFILELLDKSNAGGTLNGAAELFKNENEPCQS